MLSSGECGIIEAAREIYYDKPETTYNFEVEDFHTYYVGEGVLVHNKGCGGSGEHGNSLKTDKETELYALVDNDSPREIKKIGETTRGTKRYTRKYYNENNVKMITIDSGTKRQMHYAQNRLIHNYYDKIGRLPPFNKGFW